MKKKITAAMLMAAFVLLTTQLFSAKAFAFNNTYEKEWSYQGSDSKKPSGCKLSISSDSETDWNLREDKINEESEDHFVYYRLSADAKVGDTITLSLESDCNENYLGLTVMPRKDGKWQEGDQYRALIGKTESNKIEKTITLEPGISDVQITFSDYPDMFSSKKPGSLDVVFILELEGHNETTKQPSNLFKTLLTIFAAAMALIIVAGIMSKVSAAKKKSSK